MNMKLSDRMKTFYEERTKNFLNRKTLTIIRLDGKGFSKLTKKLNKPFDDNFSDCMVATAIYLCENIQGAKIGYTQSDEITIVLSDFDTLESQAWYDYNVQKMTSISASLATAKFNQLRLLADPTAELAHFDSRVFQVPNIDEMINVLIWRQTDCTRNSISMAAHALLKGNMTGVSGADKQDRLFKEAGVNWNDYAVKYKRGTAITKKTICISEDDSDCITRSRWLPDYNTPIFTQDKEYLQKLIPTGK